MPAAARGLYAVAAGLVAVYVASTFFRERNTTSTFFDGWVGNLGYVSCAVLCLWRAISRRASRAAWLVIGISLILFALGAILWTTLVQFMDPVPYPSVADAAFLVFYPVAYLGVGLLIRQTIPRQSRSIWFDGIIAGLGVAALEAAIVIGQISRSNQGSFHTVLTNIAYPVGDLVLVTMVVTVFVMTRGRPGRMWWTLGLGLTVFAVADSVYVLRVTSGSYVTGTPLDGVWLVGTFLVATAAWQTRERPTTAEPKPSLVVPTLFGLTSIGISVWASVKTVLPLAEALATAALVVAIARIASDYRQLRAMAETKRQAHTDDLTGLPNRRHFYETLRSRIGPEASVAVLMIDLDRFKEINDSLGHDVGDEVLRQLGPRLTAVIGANDFVARLGGDEFGVIVTPLASITDATDLAGRIRDELRKPFELDSLPLRVDASVGIAIAPVDGDDENVLLQKADVAMYEAKRSRQPWQVYSSEIDDHTRDRLELIEDLRDAVERCELEVHFQPKVDLATGACFGVEALVRWRHPQRGLLSPVLFLPLADQTGMTDPLLRYVLDRSLAQQAAWARAGHDVSVAVNLAAANLRNERLPEEIEVLLAAHGVAASRLTLELTEESVIGDIEQAVRTLDRLRALGVELSVDDFGTGFSSLSYLRQLPVSELKLDRTFLAGVPGDERAIAIVRSTIDLAHSLSLCIVAEGVETLEALTAIAAMGCDAAQGYLLGRPLPAGDVDLQPRELATKRQVSC
jgi:diguanylate cyclase